MIFDLGTPAVLVGYRVGWVERSVIVCNSLHTCSQKHLRDQHLLLCLGLSYGSMGSSQQQVRPQALSDCCALRYRFCHRQVRVQPVFIRDALLARVWWRVQWYHGDLENTLFRGVGQIQSSSLFLNLCFCGQFCTVGWTCCGRVTKRAGEADTMAFRQCQASAKRALVQRLPKHASLLTPS